MSNTIITNPDYLEQVIDSFGPIDTLNEAELEAQAEAFFRLALHPSCTYKKAISYLKRSYKINNSDPRFCYHIAILYFKHKNFNQAKKWFLKAYDICPTSHRVWLHIALLQEELNEEFNNENIYKPDDLKNKATIIKNSIVEKKDKLDSSLIIFTPSLIPKTDKKSQTDKTNEIIKKNEVEDKVDEKTISVDNLKTELSKIQTDYSKYIDGLVNLKGSPGTFEDVIHLIYSLLEADAKIINYSTNKFLSYCKVPTSKVSFSNVLEKYKYFYFYLNTILEINTNRRKIKETLLKLINDLQANEDVQLADQEKFNEINNNIHQFGIDIGVEHLDEAETSIDEHIKELKSVRELNKNTCRWSGVYDVIIENCMYNIAGETLRDNMAPLLEMVFDRIKKRPDSASSAAILSADWLISGYSTEFIRKLVSSVSNESQEGFLNFINTLCELYECKVEDLPSLLAKYLKNNTINELTATLIHKNRYTWRKIKFDKNFEYKESVKYLSTIDENDDKEEIFELNQNIKSLLDGLKSLWNPKKVPTTIKHQEISKVAAKSYSLEEVAEFTNKLSDSIDKLQMVNNDLQSEFLKNFNPRLNKISNEEDYAYVVKQLEGIDTLEIFYSEFIQSAANQINDINSNLPNNISDQEKIEITEKTDNLQSKLKSLNSLTKIQKNIAKKLAKKASLKGGNYDQGIDQPLITIIETVSNTTSNFISKSNSESAEDIDVFKEFDYLSVIKNEILAFLEKFQIEFLKDFNKQIKNVKTEEEYSIAKTNIEEIKKINHHIKNICSNSQTIISKLELMVKNIGEDEKKEFISQSEILNNAFKEFESRCPKTVNFEKRIVKFADQFNNTEMPPNATLSGLFLESEQIDNKLTTYFKNNLLLTESKEDSNVGNSFYDEIGLQKSEEINKYKSDLTGNTGLKQAIKLVENEITELIDYSIESFKYYENKHLKNPIFADLQADLLNQAAEAFFMLGLYNNAKYYWNAVIRLKEIDSKASKNIAVAETMLNQSDENILNAWKMHCEHLYTYDVLIKDPSAHASARIDMHMKLASVYAPELTKIKEDKKQDENAQNIKAQQFINLLNNPCQLYEYVAHKIAEYINQKLEIKTPILFLGLNINATENEIIQASSRLNEFYQMACSLLPERISKAFLSLCLNHIEKAKDICLDSDNLTLNKNVYYEKDKKKLQQSIRDILELKQQLFQYISNANEKLNNIQYIDCVFILDLLNSIPIDMDLNLQDEIAYSLFGMYQNTNPAELPKIFANNIIQVPLQVFLKNIFNSDNSKNSEQFYKRISKIIIEGNAYPIDNESYIIEIIDNPTNFLPEFVLSYLKNSKNRDPNTKEHIDVVNYLVETCEKYPGYTGLARLLSSLDSEKGLHALKNAQNHAFSVLKKLECTKQLEVLDLNTKLNMLQTHFKSNDYGKAFQLYLKITEIISGKLVITEESINEIKGLQENTIKKLKVLCGRYFADKKELINIMQNELGILDKNILNKIVSYTTDADASFLKNYLLNIVKGWTGSDPNEIIKHIDEIYQELYSLNNIKDESNEEWLKNSNQLLINASIGYIGKMETEQHFKNAIKGMEKLISLNNKNYQALYYLALFNQNLAAIITRNSGIDLAKQYYSKAYAASTELRAIDLGEGLNAEIIKMNDYLEENKDKFL